LNRRVSRFPVRLGLGACFIGLIALGLWVYVGGGRRWIVFNTSPSVMPGLYVRSEQLPGVGELVSFEIPLAARPYIRDRTGYDGAGWYLLKPIVAGPGDVVDTTRGVVRVNGVKVADMPDVEGRVPAVPLSEATRVLGQNEFFVLSTRIPNSFDSRCFGPIREGDIETVRRALVTW
jgi:type IV secretory pathway protease TraF